MKLAVIGLGKLGAPLAAVLAEAGHDVVGADVSARAVDALNRGVAPVQEPGLQDLLDRNRDRIRATCDIADAVAASEATFVIVPTPSGDDGMFSLDFVLS